MLMILFCAAVAAMQLAPDTVLGRALRRLLVEAPARLLSRVRPGHLILLLLASLALWAAFAAARSEGAFLLAQGAPEAIAWIATLDIASALDALALALLLAATVRLKALRMAVKVIVQRVVARSARRSARARRARSRPRPPGAASNDDEAPAPLRLAA